MRMPFLPTFLPTVLWVLAGSFAQADHRWIMPHYGDTALAPPSAALSFLDSTIAENGESEVWVRVPKEPVVRGKIYDAVNRFVRDAEFPLDPGEARHPFSVGNLSPGSYRLVLESTEGTRLAESLFHVGNPDPPEHNRIALLVDEPAGRDWKAFPVSFGIPFPRGVLDDIDQVRIVDGSGREMPSQLRVTGTWDPDARSIKWIQAVFFADSTAGEGHRYYLEHGSTVRPAESIFFRPPPLGIEESDDTLILDADRLRVTINKRRGTIVENMLLDGKPVVGHGALYVQDGDRQVFSSKWDKDPPDVSLEESGPLRAVVRQQGWYANEEGERLCRYDVRLQVFAGQPFVRVLHTWILTHDSRAVQFGDIALRLATVEKMETAAFSPGGDSGAKPFAAELGGRDRVSLIQSDSDTFFIKAWGNGGEDQSPALREGFPHTERSDGAAILHSGVRSGGSVAVMGPETGVVGHVREMWQQYPAELEAGESGVAFHFWPAHGFYYQHREREIEPLHRWPLSDGPLMDLQPRGHVEDVLMRNTERVLGYDQINALGLAKTHEIWIELNDGTDPATAAVNARARFEDTPAVRADPEWIGQTRIFRPFLPVDKDAFPVEEEAIRARWDAVEDLQDRFHNYGWLHYGDHQTYPPLIGESGSAAFQAHRYWRGPSYRAGVEPWLLWMRSGERRYLRQAEAMARHFMDIDHVHWGSDEVNPPRRSGQSYLQALSHYNSRFGGMVHNEPVGFSLMYFHLTGYARARDFLETVADVIHPYSVHPHRTIARGDMSTARHLFHLYRETWDRKFYDNAWEIVTRMLDDLIVRQLNPSHTTYMYELLNDWREMTGDSRVEPALRSLTDMYMDKPLGVIAVYPVLFDFGHLYELTGDPEYIAWGKGILQSCIYDVAVQADPPRRGRVTRVDSISLTRTLRQVPGFLHYVRKAEERHGPIQPRIQPIKFRDTVKPVYLWNEDGGDFRIRVFLSFSFRRETWPAGGRVTGKARISDADGNVVAETDIDSKKHYVDLFVSENGRPGSYTLTLAFDDDIDFGRMRSGITMDWGLGNPDGLKIAYGARRITYNGGHVFFHVPADTRSFTLHFPGLVGYAGEPAIVNAGGKVLARARGPFHEPYTFHVDLPEGHRGETYGLVSSRGTMAVELGEELPPYFYSDPTEFFKPPSSSPEQSSEEE